MIANPQSGTNVVEIADATYRINTPVEIEGASASRSTSTLASEEPLLFHTGPRKLFPLVREAVASVLGGREQLRWVAFLSRKRTKCGPERLAQGGAATVPLCGAIAAMVSIGDLADREPRALADGRRCPWASTRCAGSTPHLPHAWECGYLMVDTTGTLPAAISSPRAAPTSPAVTESDILGPSEEFRLQMDYQHSKNAPALIERLAAAKPTTLAHARSAWRRRREAPPRARGRSPASSTR